MGKEDQNRQRGDTFRYEGSGNEFFTPDQIDRISLVVRKYFGIVDHYPSGRTLTYYVTLMGDDLEQNYENMRYPLKELGLFARIEKRSAHHVLFIMQYPPIAAKKITLWNVMLFLLTLITTIWAGTLLWSSYVGYQNNLSGDLGALISIFEVLVHPEFVLSGTLSFALPLLLILGLHEMGHYIASIRNNVDASFPYFIPIPPFIGMLGTFGAFIKIREPMPNKKSLVQIGAAGPIAGFLVAIPIIFIGFYLTVNYPGTSAESLDGAMMLGEPLLYRFIAGFFDVSAISVLHPTAFAGWVGLLVTAFNLLPAGQLDGGHIARGLFGKNAKYFSYLSVGALLYLGYKYYSGWLIFSLLIVFLGLRHPPPLNDISPLKFREKMIGLFSIAILVLCFIPQPMSLEKIDELEPEFEMVIDDNFRSVWPGERVEFVLPISNTGRGVGSYEFIISVEYDDFMNVNVSALELWNVSVTFFETSGIERSMSVDLSNFFTGKEVGKFELSLLPLRQTWVNLTVNSSSELEINSELRFALSVRDSETGEFIHHLPLGVRVASVELYAPVVEEMLKGGVDLPLADFSITIMNIAPFSDNLSVATIFLYSDNMSGDVWESWTNATSPISLVSGESYTFGLKVQVPWNLTVDTQMSVQIFFNSEKQPSQKIFIPLRVVVEFPVND